LDSEAQLNNTKQSSLYFTENTLHLYYKDTLVNAAQGNNHCLLWEP